MSWRFCQDVGLLSNKMELNGNWPVLFRYICVAQSKKKTIEILNCHVLEIEVCIYLRKMDDEGL